MLVMFYAKRDKADFASDYRKSLLCLVRMGFLRQARAGLATSGCTLELNHLLPFKKKKEI